MSTENIAQGGPQHARQHVAGSAGRHSRVTCGIDPGAAGRRGDHGLVTLQDHDRVPILRCFSRYFEAARLDFLRWSIRGGAPFLRDAASRRDSLRCGFQFRRAAGEGVQAVGIEDDWHICRYFPTHSADELNCFRVRRKPGTDREDAFPFRDSVEAFVLESAQAKWFRRRWLASGSVITSGIRRGDNRQHRLGYRRR